MNNTALAGWDAGEAPRVEPLTYPGRWPPQSILLTSAGPLALHPVRGRRLGQASVAVDDGSLPGDSRGERGVVPLNYALLRCNTARVDDRVPVLAVGSNASPAQMRHKYQDEGVSLVIPMVSAHVEGLAAGIAPAVAQAGYVPATPVLGPDLTDRLFVQWLDLNQLAELDATELGYQRVLLPAGDPASGGVRIVLPSGEVLGACYAYAHRAGCLALADEGDPLLLEDQRRLLVKLLAASPRLQDLLGNTAESWVERVAEPEIADAVKAIFVDEGWVRRQSVLDALDGEQQAPEGASSSPDVGPRPTVARTYGRIPPATPPVNGTWRIVPTHDPIDRAGQTVIRVGRSAAERLGHPVHVAVRSAATAARPETSRLETIALVLVGPDDPDAPTGEGGPIEVDQIIREAIGVELGEDVTLTPVTIRRRRWLDHFIGSPLYITCRVQVAELATAEREVCLLDSLTLELLGVRSGDEVVVEGRANDDGEVGQIRIKAFTTTDATQQSRESLIGGDFSVRYPSSRDALGIHPDIPWIFIDSSTRWMLRLDDQRLATVRVRPSRSFQLRRELREMLLILGIAFIGLIELVTQTWARLGVLAVMVTVVLMAIAVRMRGRLSHRVVRGRNPRR